MAHLTATSHQPGENQQATGKDCCGSGEGEQLGTHTHTR